MAWSYFGWEGIGVEVPEAWELAKVTGTREKGSFSLDDGEQVRLELKWEKPRRLPPVEQVVRRYTNFLRRQSRKRKLSLDIDESVNFELPSAEQSAFSWKVGKDLKGGSSAFSLASACRECGRVSLMHVMGKKGDPPRAVARQVFASFQDHSPTEEERWRIFGLDFTLPTTFRLEGSSFRAGCSRLSFAEGHKELEVARVALGETTLRRQKFPDWLWEFYRKKLRRFLWYHERASFKGHLGIRFWGEEMKRRTLIRAFQKVDYLSGWAWYCERSDKILTLWLTGRPDDEGELAGQLAGKIRCH